MVGNNFNSANPNDALDKVLPLIALDNNYRGVTSGLTRNRGDQPASYNSNNEPWGGKYDQTVYRNPAAVRVPVTNSPVAPGFSINSALGMGVDWLKGIGYQNPNIPSPSAVTAINKAAPRQVDEFGFYTDAPPVPGGKSTNVFTSLLGSALDAGKTLVGTASDAINDSGVIEGATNMGEALVEDAKADPRAIIEATMRRSGIGGVLSLLGQQMGFGQSVPQMKANLEARSAKNIASGAKRPITYDTKLARPSAGTRFSVTGDDMAFQPMSVQTSSRWNTGY